MPTRPTEDYSKNKKKRKTSAAQMRGTGTRLYLLTKKRAKLAVPLGANYRLIDIPVINCLNRNISKSTCSHISTRCHSIATFLEIMETTLAVTRMKVFSQLVPSRTADAVR